MILSSCCSILMIYILIIGKSIYRIAELKKVEQVHCHERLGASKANSRDEN